jgi:hypothetical protein
MTQLKALVALSLQPIAALLFFSAKPEFVEAAVVSGFVEKLRSASKKARTAQIEIRAPAGGAFDFPEKGQYPEMFVTRIDQHRSWRHSFLRALGEVDGVILIGGGRFGAATGILALAYKIPLLAVSTFGGAAKEVWETIKPGTDLPTAEETSEMARTDWTADSALACIKGLLAQGERRHEKDAATRQIEQIRRKLSIRAWLGGAILIGAIVLTWWASWPTTNDAWRTLALYFLPPPENLWAS